MRKLVAAIILALATPAWAVGPWTSLVRNCGTNPAVVNVASGDMGSRLQFVTVTGTIGTGTVTSCQFYLNNDGSVAFDPDNTPSCIAEDQTAGVLLPTTFTVSNLGSWSYGRIGLTSAANMAGHTVTLWCVR